MVRAGRHGQQGQSPGGDPGEVAVGRHTDPDGERGDRDEGRRPSGQRLVAERPDGHEHRGRRAGAHHDTQGARPPGATEPQPVEPEEGEQRPRWVPGDRDVPRSWASWRGCARRTPGRASGHSRRGGAGPDSRRCRSCGPPIPVRMPSIRVSATVQTKATDHATRTRGRQGRRRAILGPQATTAMARTTAAAVDQLPWGSQTPRIGAVPARGCSWAGFWGTRGVSHDRCRWGTTKAVTTDDADDAGPDEVGPVASEPRTSRPSVRIPPVPGERSDRAAPGHSTRGPDRNGWPRVPIGVIRRTGRLRITLDGDRRRGPRAGARAATPCNASWRTGTVVHGPRGIDASPPTSTRCPGDGGRVRRVTGGRSGRGRATTVGEPHRANRCRADGRHADGRHAGRRDAGRRRDP